MAKGSKAAGPAQLAGTSPSSAYDKYQDEDDHRTLSRAAEVQSDPKRMAGVKRHQKRQQRTLSTVGRMIGGKR